MGTYISVDPAKIKQGKPTASQHARVLAPWAARLRAGWLLLSTTKQGDKEKNNIKIVLVQFVLCNLKHTGGIASHRKSERYGEYDIHIEHIARHAL